MPYQVQQFLIGRKDDDRANPCGWGIEMPVGAVPMGVDWTIDPRTKGQVPVVMAAARIGAPVAWHPLILASGGAPFEPTIGRKPERLIGVLPTPGGIIAVIVEGPWPTSTIAAIGDVQGQA